MKNRLALVVAMLVFGAGFFVSVVPVYAAPLREVGCLCTYSNGGMLCMSGVTSRDACDAYVQPTCPLGSVNCNRPDVYITECQYYETPSECEAIRKEIYQPEAEGDRCFCAGVGDIKAQCFPLDKAQCAATVGAGQCTYKESVNACEVAVLNARPGTAQTVGKFIPGCVDEKNGSAYLKSECGSILVFVTLAFNIIDYLFGIIGGVALLFFIYGGFMLILSQGNSEKVEQGKGIIMAAVLGIAIAFAGYAMINFAGQVAGIKQDYRLK